jgi:glycolate oxidase iron-sulfur subunit
MTVAPEHLAACVSCGLCLPHCPTYRVTGAEDRSPRGRIQAMRAVADGRLTLDAVAESMDTCVQCRGCETACPSGVPFGTMIAATRRDLAAGPARRRSRPWALLYRLVAIGLVLRVISTLLAVAQRAGVVPSRRLGLPRRLPLRRPRLAPSGSEVWLFTGCVMDAWQRDVHVDALRVVTAAGAGVDLPRPGGCCGALAEHAGLHDLARRQAANTMARFPGDAPILVDSAGCGAMLKEYGDHFDLPGAPEFAARVRDVHEWLADRLDRLPPNRAGWVPPIVAVQDPCHLRHAQRRHHHVHQVLAGRVELRHLDDDGLCCGAGGAFAVAQPALAERIRVRKIDSIARSGAPIVASANPGCSMHLEWAGLDVRHPVSLVADAIAGDRPGSARPARRSR